MTTTKTDRQIYLDAADEIERHGHVKQALCDPAFPPTAPHVRRCIAGAVNFAATGDAWADGDDPNFWGPLGAKIATVLGLFDYQAVIDWNNDDERTEEEVVAALRAAAAAEPEEA